MPLSLTDPKILAVKTLFLCEFAQEHFSFNVFCVVLTGGLSSGVSLLKITTLFARINRDFFPTICNNLIIIFDTALFFNRFNLHLSSVVWNLLVNPENGCNIARLANFLCTNANNFTGTNVIFSLELGKIIVVLNAKNG